MIDKKAYKILLDDYEQSKEISLLNLFQEDPNRIDKYTLAVQGIYLDYSKNNINDKILHDLIELAHQSDLHDNIHAMFSGNKINNTENRAVLHTLLRDTTNQHVYVDGKDVSLDIAQVIDKMSIFADKLHSNEHLGYTNKKITDIVNIGIGGSDLGPHLACDALKPYRKNNLKIHFISSIDGYQLQDVLSELTAETTLFVISSKTFTTEETITNALSAKKWFLEQTDGNNAAIMQHFIACSANIKAATEFGINPENIFTFWDFVGGRYSMWSAIGLPIMLYIGSSNFKEMLSGASMMDQHFLTTHDYSQNLPVILALLGIWYVNFYNYPTQVVLPYNTRLAKLADYLQQQQMESNGKRVDKNGKEMQYQTCPVIWGGSGINGQHAYFQLLHQGTQIHPMDLIITTSSSNSCPLHQDILIANIFAQSEAFMAGKSTQVAENELLNKGLDKKTAGFLAKHKTFIGNRPTNTILLKEISPYYLGALIALYEHKTFVQGVIWGLNSFDQWGVELGKELAKKILKDIKENNNNKNSYDESTFSLIQKYLKVKHYA